MADWGHADLIRGLEIPCSGRRGKLSVEQVLMALFIKQMNDFSYEVLAYHLADTRTYRPICGFGVSCSRGGDAHRAIE